MDSEGRPTTLFPLLRRLFLASADTLSLYIASNSMASLRFLKVDSTSEFCDSTTRDHCRAMTAGLSQNATSLTALRIDSPISFTMVGHIAQIKTLTFLRVCIGYAKAIHSLDFARLACLPLLTTLQIDQDMDSIPAITKVPGPNLNVKSYISGKTVFKKLRDLYIRASGITQYYVAGLLLSSNLRTLKMEMITDAINAQLALLPLVLAIYATRNPFLVSVSANGHDARSGLPNTIQLTQLRNLQRNIHYANLDIFFDGIAALRNLQSLEISNSPFIAVDFVPRLLDIMPRLSLLRTLKLSASPAADLAPDEPVLPRLEVFQALCENNRHLSRLEIAVELPQVLLEPPTKPSSHGLKLLVLQSSIDYAHYGMEDKFKLARYIERLFPQAEIVANGTNPGEKEFWGFINRLLAFSRASREQALIDLGRTESA